MPGSPETNTMPPSPLPSRSRAATPTADSRSRPIIGAVTSDNAAGRSTPEPESRECSHDIGLPLELEGDGIAPIEERCDLPRVASPTSTAPGSAVALEPRRCVQRIACRCVRHHAPRALGSEDHEARFDADPHGELRQAHWSISCWP